MVMADPSDLGHGKNIVTFSGFFSESAWFHCGMCGLTNLVLNTDICINNAMIFIKTTV